MPSASAGPALLALRSRSAEETARLGACLARRLRPGDVVLLEGELGAGKTCFTKGLARGLGIRDEVRSPTFILHEEYAPGCDAAGRAASPPHPAMCPRLHHWDLYRLTPGEDFAELGLDDALADEAITVVEWPDRAAGLFPRSALTIHIAVADDDSRLLTFASPDPGWGARLQPLGAP